MAGDEGHEARPGPGRWILATAAGIVALCAYAGWLAASPDEARICTHLIELAANGDEAIDETGRARCEQHYAGLRDGLGWRGWARFARCSVDARTLSDAGGC